MLRKKIASTAGLIAVLLGTISGEAMRPRGEGEDLRFSPVSVLVDEIEYRIVGDEAKVCGYRRGKRNVSVSSCVFVPAYGRCCFVTGIAENCFRYTSVKDIVIPGTVQILGSSCFEGCKSLTSVSFETDSQLRRIEVRAFHRSSLKSITIPRNVLSFLNLLI
ncbi:MAG: leucine-rich repeat domain-containing protein [Holosporales bacterium]|jgi:hypothetical protein|nr:leucine-rich repeat domain-containing protein [Holosporales bacterium]